MNPLPAVDRVAISPCAAPTGPQGLLDAARRAARQGDPAGPAAHSLQALALAQSCGCRHTEAAALVTLAEAEARLGDGERAITHSNRAMMLRGSVRDNQARARNLCTLVLAYLCVGLPADALACATEAIATARADADLSLVSWTPSRAGSTYSALGQSRRAIELLEDAFELAREAGLVEEQSSACNNLFGALLALAATQSGTPREGERALALITHAGNGYGVAMGNGVPTAANLATVRRFERLLQEQRAQRQVRVLLNEPS